MKRLLVLFLTLCLVACDNKPMADFKTVCSVDKDWQNQINGIIESGDWQEPQNQAKVNVGVKIFDTYALLDVNGKQSVFKKNKEEAQYDLGMIFIHYIGKFPDSERIAEYSVVIDMNSKKINQENLSFVGQKHRYKDKLLGIGWECLSESTGVFNHKYSIQSETEKCINKIVDTVYFTQENSNELAVWSDGKRFTLSSEDAYRITPNWDYENMKPYSNADGVVQNYEKDACEVLERLYKYMDEHGL